MTHQDLNYYQQHATAEINPVYRAKKTQLEQDLERLQLEGQQEEAQINPLIDAAVRKIRETATEARKQIPEYLNARGVLHSGITKDEIDKTSAKEVEAVATEEHERSRRLQAVRDRISLHKTQLPKQLADLETDIQERVKARAFELLSGAQKDHMDRQQQDFENRLAQQRLGLENLRITREFPNTDGLWNTTPSTPGITEPKPNAPPKTNAPGLPPGSQFRTPTQNWDSVWNSLGKPAAQQIGPVHPLDKVMGGYSVKSFVPGTPPKYQSLISSASAKHGIPPTLLSALLKQESGFADDVVTGRRKSSAGALGIAQFMPATARGMGVDPLNPTSAIDGAARYLANSYKQFGRWDLALAAYNAGGGAVSKYKGIPPFKETQNYVASIRRMLA